MSRDLVPLLRAEAAEIRAHHPGIGYVATLYTQSADELERLRGALERIATDGGWQTSWNVDEAEPELGKQPSITNEARTIARAALEAAE